MALSVSLPTATVTSNSLASDTDITTAAFNGVVDALLVVILKSRDVSTGITAWSGSHSLLGALTLRKSFGFADNSQAGGVAIFTIKETSTSSCTISARRTSPSSENASLTVYRVTGQHLTTPTGATGGGNFSTDPADVAVYTNTVDGSIGFLGFVDDNDNASFTSSNCSGIESFRDTGTNIHISQYLTTPTSGTGVGVTMNCNASTSAPNANWAAIEVVPAASGPTISAHPQNASCYVGETANFSITASGTGTLHYQWKDDGSNVGTDSSSYTTAAATTGDNGAQITCVVTDDLGNATSNAATWTVQFATKAFYIKA